MSVSLEARVAQLESELAVIKAQLAAGKARVVTPDLPEVDIDNAHGNPVVRKDPPRWKGASFVGQPYSMCTPAYLRELAGFLKWKAGKNVDEGRPDRARWDMLDAARALAHAARIESMAKTAAKTPSVPQDFDEDGQAELYASQFDDGEIPF